MKKNKTMNPNIFEQQVILACKGYGELDPKLRTIIIYTLMKDIDFNDVFNKDFEPNLHNVNEYNNYYNFLLSIVQKYVDNSFDKIIKNGLPITDNVNFIDLEENNIDTFIKLLSTVDDKKYKLSPDYYFLNYKTEEILKYEILKHQSSIIEIEKLLKKYKERINNFKKEKE